LLLGCERRCSTWEVSQPDKSKQDFATSTQLFQAGNTPDLDVLTEYTKTTGKRPMPASSMRSRCGQIALYLFFCGISCGSLLSAHQSSQSSAQTQPPIFRSEHNEVEVVVIVRDSKGRPVTNLKQSDFEIRDNGKLQTINSFAIQGGTQQDLTASTPTTATTVSPTAKPQAAQRRFVALFFDDVHTQAGDFGRVQKAAEQFVQESLQPDDRVAVFKTSGNGEVTFTNDKSKLLATIGALRAHTLQNTSTIRQCPRLTSYEAYLIVNQLDPDVLNIVALRAQNCMCPPPASVGCPPPDEFKRMAQGYAQETWQTQKNSSQNLLADLDLTVRALGTMPGRRMLVLSSAGFLSGDLDSDVNRVIDHALLGGVVINVLSAMGLYAETPGGNLSEQRLEGTFTVGNGEVSKYEARQFGAKMQAEDAAMIDFAESTGGRFFNNNNDFLRGFNQLMTSETAYLMVFSPRPLKQDGKFHKLEITVKLAGNFSIYARKGYFASPEKEIKAARSTSGSELPITVSNADARATTETKTGAITVPTPEKIAIPAEVKQVETPAQPITGATGGPNTHPTAQSAPTTIASNNVSPSPAADEPTTTDVAARRGSEIAFLNSASREVEHYIQAFGDLTADETRSMEVFDEHGLSSQMRTMRSTLVVYRLRTEPASVIEYRDVLSVDGRQIKDHTVRARKVWEGLAKANSPEDEIKRITTDAERYDIGLQETGFTLFEGLPLRALCAGDFGFRELRREIMDGRRVLVFAYNQIHPCSVGKYHLHLPDPYVTYPLEQAGELALDVETGQIIQEERNVYAGNLKKQPPRVAHIVLSYGESSFGIRVPKMIVMETFRPIKNPNMITTGNFRLYARMVQTYGPFSRFEVSTTEKDAAANR
jgi:VWFA-related protein